MGLKKTGIKKLSRLITLVEERPEKADEILKGLKGNGKRAKIIGFTGTPGSGKSSLISAVIDHLRKKDSKIAIVAFDPRSPLSGGTFFGDRIRMGKHYLDENVFIRSISGDGNGGISPVLYDIIRLIERFEFDYILVESVGTGQSEIDLNFFVDVLVLVLSPGNGDDIQFLKSGIMEVADIYAVNKSDLKGYMKFFNLLRTLPGLDDKKLVKVSALTGDGIDELCDAVDRYWEELARTGKLFKKRKKAILKQAQMFIVRRLESIVGDLEYNLEFDNLHRAIEFLKEKLVNDLEG